MASFKKANLPENLSLNVDAQKEFHKKVKELEKDAPRTGGPGVVFIKHIPHGFFEPQMKAYFTQFGKIKRLRMSRSKKSGRIKGYGYVEFAEDSVAKIVASTMNNYLMFNRLIKCTYVPQEDVHKDTFKGCDRKFSKPKAHALSRQRHNTVKTPEQMAKAEGRARAKQKKGLAKLAEMGIEYELPGMVTKEEIRAVAAQPSAEDTKSDVIKEKADVGKPGKRGKAKAADKPAPVKKRKVEEKEENEEEEEEEGSDEDSESEENGSDIENEDSDDSGGEDFDFDKMFGTSQKTDKVSQKDTVSKKNTPAKQEPARTGPKKVGPKDSPKTQTAKSQPQRQGGKRGGRGGRKR